MGAQSSSTDDEFTDGSSGLPRLFSDASLYERFLNDGGSVERLGHLKDHSENEVVKGFTDLVAVDLESDSKAKAITDRFAKIAVTGDSWPGPFAEPESYEPDVDMDKYSLDDGEKEGSRPLTPPNISRSSTLDREAPKLTSDEIIDLLVQEFGPLAAEGEEEKLIIEADAAWIHDVVILAS
jgi:sterol 3beta-glucosyltransferase